MDPPQQGIYGHNPSVRCPQNHPEVTEIFGHSRAGEIIAPSDGLYRAGLTLRKRTD
ncbi:MAG: hypothetical protein JOZ61_07570 [Verrucomicrobia bacterium]|nr:hypothetical protein [Verrucomicrobiota bacterium]